MQRTARALRVGAACAASVAGVMVGAAIGGPQEVKARFCESDYCAEIDPVFNFFACQNSSSGDTGCNVTGNYRCDTYSCS